MRKPKKWPPRRFGRDAGDSITVGEILAQLEPLARGGKTVKFIAKLDELFLRGAWGHVFGEEFQMCPRDACDLAKDIRGLIYAALRRGAERQ